MSAVWADRNGNRIEMAEWLGLQMTKEYCILKQDTVNDITVSTIWTGAGSDYQPKLMIFETVTFAPNGPADWDGRCWRYATEEEALAGHQEVCAAIYPGVSTLIQEEE